ncbi:hypothetical protein B9Z55_005807 [Caenorhabditis nigoni]|uniref:Tetratricopeptide SHNi-TPR domain-containing protein n=1 Tax=Caenorhabditis nigoni TaxID=1611254 RepID=A0A2G5V2V9_9PELO|nr:hypothetical protein B9Z55_005807 [Caenorhabditis nigoni]
MSVEDSAEVPVQDMEVEKANDELTREQKEKRAAELLAAGRRALKVSDYETATEALSEASETIVELYGSDHEITYEYYYYYGMATLELGKIQSQVFNAPNEKEDNGDAQNSAAAGTSTNEKGEGDGEDSEKEDGEESGDEEDDDTMKLAWEVLENARCIAMAKIEVLKAERSGVSVIEEWQLKLADVLVVLGDHSVSDGKYDQALEDLEQALEIQKNVLPSNSRKIAQTYILMADACTSGMKYDEAINYFEKTKETLKSRSEHLETELKEVGDQEKKLDMQDELKDLEEMIPLIDDKIADSKSSAEQMEKTKEAIKAQFDGFAALMSQLPQSSEQKEANDISNLVRRPAKRPVEAAETTPEEKKKTKAEEEEGTSEL